METGVVRKPSIDGKGNTNMPYDDTLIEYNW
jgi:hypothetical protein